jgi:hypothetical protein
MTDYVSKEDCRERHCAVDKDLGSIYSIYNRLNERLSRIEGKLSVHAAIGALIGSTISGVLIAVIMLWIKK